MKLRGDPSRRSRAGKAWAGGADIVSFSDMALLLSFASATHRPNLLVACDDADPGAVIDRLQELCVPPFHGIALPGPLTLPALIRGTLLLHDVSELTLTQQVTLHDWMNVDRSGLQIVSVTQVPLPSFVPNRFLERLFYRLNTVCVVATRGRLIH